MVEMSVSCYTVLLLHTVAVIHKVVNIKAVNFIVCKLYLNKADYKKEISPTNEQKIVDSGYSPRLL